MVENPEETICKTLLLSFHDLLTFCISTRQKLQCLLSLLVYLLDGALSVGRTAVEEWYIDGGVAEEGFVPSDQILPDAEAELDSIHLPVAVIESALAASINSNMLLFFCG